MKKLKMNEITDRLAKFVAEKDLYPMLLDMGNPIRAIYKFQKTRMLQTAVLFIALSLFAYVVDVFFFIVAFIISHLFYKMKYSKIKSMYIAWRFNRQLQFSKFIRMLIPYLKKSDGHVSLYKVLNKIVDRLDTEEDRNSLYKLMSEMSHNPNDITPFIEFANRSSGTDVAVLFMSAIFDFHQNSYDDSGIDELGKIANEELLKAVDEIIAFKTRRFVFFPTKIVMTTFVIVVGFTFSVIYANMSGITL